MVADHAHRVRKEGSEALRERGRDVVVAEPVLDVSVGVAHFPVAASHFEEAGNAVDVGVLSRLPVGVETLGTGRHVVKRGEDRPVVVRDVERLAVLCGEADRDAGERVEGYTTFIWVCLLAMGQLLGFGLVLFSKILGTAFALACFALLANTRRFIPEVELGTAAVATLLLASCSVFTLWAMGGMDSTMVAFWVLSSLLVHLPLSENMLIVDWVCVIMMFSCLVVMPC